MGDDTWLSLFPAGRGPFPPDHKFMAEEAHAIINPSCNILQNIFAKPLHIHPLMSRISTQWTMVGRPIPFTMKASKNN